MGDLSKPLPEFTPVPLRARRDGWTPERQFAYVVALAAFGHGGRAAHAVEMTEQSACRLRRRPGAAAFNWLCEAGDGALDAELGDAAVAYVVEIGLGPAAQLKPHPCSRP
jgi:hypothetical protein